LRKLLKVLAILALLVVIGGFILHEVLKPSYPIVVSVYQWRYSQMSTLEGREELVNYTKFTLYDSIEGLSYLGLLQWEHRYLEYTEGELDYPRPELPIPILKRGKGRCGEFALLYIGLLLANNIECRLVIDCSTLQNTSKTAAGDHVWAEVWVPRFNRWVHIDPTEKIIDQPDMYAKSKMDGGWEKDVNLVYAITTEEIVDVTETYN